jgi:hypothetical protein
MNKSKNKKLVKKYYASLASVPIIKKIPRLLGPGLNKAGKCYVLSYASRVDLLFDFSWLGVRTIFLLS